MKTGMLMFVLALAAMSLGACANTQTSTSKYSDGKPRLAYEYVFDDGQEVRHGEYRSWHKNGLPKAQGAYHEGLKDGVWTYWREDGKRSKRVTFEKDKRHGPFESWYSNGEPQSKGQFVEARRDGEWSYFHNNGQKRSTGRYEDGRHAGRWSFWTDEGELHAHVTYPAADDGAGKREFIGDAPATATLGDDQEVGPFCSKDHIGAVVSAFSGELKHCYERELQNNKNLKGEVLGQWKIGLRGEVLSASIRRTTMDNQTVEECITDVVGQMQFQPHDGGICIINYPFVFSPAE